MKHLFHKKVHMEKMGHSVGMLHSIRTKLIFIMLLMMGFMLFLFWLGTLFLLGTFYVRSKVKLLEDS